MLKGWGLAIIAASAVAFGPANAVTRQIPAAKLQPIVRQGILSAIAIIRDHGTSGLRMDLEKCYRKVAATRDQTAAIYCITQDRYATASTTGLFPGGVDPYFNFDAFAARASKATDQTVQPASSRSAFIGVLGSMQDVETKEIVEQLRAAKAQDGQ